MIAIDTNILVRLLVDDPGQPEQVRAARTLAQQAGAVYVPTIVLVECVWVLDSAYHFNKSALLTALSHLCGNDAFVLQDLESTLKALEYYRDGTADFADYLILVQSQQQGLDLHTFDQRLARQPGVRLLETIAQAS
jgi:predicted nucleic-acid-binding protein